jgi:hypothetical protein
LKCSGLKTALLHFEKDGLFSSLGKYKNAVFNIANKPVSLKKDMAKKEEHNMTNDKLALIG